jgi:hypothetical protein
MWRDYEIRYLKSDGSTTLLYLTNCPSNRSAITAMRTMFALEFDRVELWREDHLVCVERKGPIEALPFKRAAQR